MRLFAAGFVVGFAVALAYSLLERWWSAKAEVNEARRRHGIPQERRWWKL
jgi:hypothetical protein